MNKANNIDPNIEASKQTLTLNGVIDELLPGAKFRIILENGNPIIGHLSGKMRMNRIRLGVGDKVKIEMTPYDLTKGRITFRY